MKNLNHVILQVASQVAAVTPSDYEVVSIVEHIGGSINDGHYVVHHKAPEEW
jgi:ubiquitin C-terminal hydrolase